MENEPKNFIELTPQLHKRCLEYMRRRGLSEKTKLYYAAELDNIFKNPALTQTLYNKVHSRGGYYGAVLKLITDTCDHFDIPNHKYKIIKRIRKPNKKPQVWHENDIQKIISNIDEYGLLVSCAYYIGAGLRFSSAIMLSWDDFIWEDWILDKTKVGKCNIRAKGDKEAVLNVDPILMNKLYTIALSKGKMFQSIPYKNSAEDLFLFISRNDMESLEEKYKKENFDNILDSNLEKVNIKDRARVEMIRKMHYLVDYRMRKLSKLFNGKRPKLHSIRSSRATHLLKKGFRLLTIKEQLMHNSIATTEIYLNVENIDTENEFNEKL